MGKLDEDGFLYILDRKKDMIISGGINIFTSDIEEVLAKHPDVQDCTVIGIPHEKWGETPLALAIMYKGATISEDDLKAWLNGKVAKYQRVSGLVFKDDFPRNALGKVLKKELREAYGKIISSLGPTNLNQGGFMSKVSIIGAYNTKFGAFVEKNRETREVKDTKSYYDLLIEAGKGAIEDAGLEAGEIDGIWIGSCSPSLFINQEHVGPLGLEVAPEALRFVPTTRTEGACASSSVALYNAIYGMESGRFKRVLVIGVEKMNLLTTKDMTHVLACSSHWPHRGRKRNDLSRTVCRICQGLSGALQLQLPKNCDKCWQPYRLCVTVTDWKIPWPISAKGVLRTGSGLTTAEAILNLPDEGKGSNPMIAPPLRLHDCSLVTDGAAALVIAPTDEAESLSNQGC